MWLWRSDVNAVAREGRAGAGNLHRARGDRVDILRSGRGGAGESPGAGCDDANTDALVGRIAESLGRAVLSVDLLNATDNRASVGIARACDKRALDGALDQVFHGDHSSQLLRDEGGVWLKVEAELGEQLRGRLQVAQV